MSPAFLLMAAMSISGDPQAGSQPPSLPERLEKMLGGDDKPFALLINVYIKPGTETEFEAAAAKASKATTAEDGCLMYQFVRDLEKPGHYTLIERWKGLGPLRKHLQQDHTKEIQAVFAKLSTTPRTVTLAAPVEEK